jgi:peptidoglycan/xylan/chitin deacetylase (PgdA/CDA1 family)
MIVQKLKSMTRRLLAASYFSSRHFLSRFQGKLLILTYHRVLSEREIHKNWTQPGMYVRDDVFASQMAFLKQYFDLLSFSELLALWREKEWDKAKRYCVITFDDGWLDNYLYAYPILKKHQIPATIFLPTSFIGTDRWFWPDQVGSLLRQYYSSRATKRGEIFASLRSRWPELGFLEEGIAFDKMDDVIEALKKLPHEEIDLFLETFSKEMEIELPRQRVLLNWEEVKEMSRFGISFGSHSVTHRILTSLPPKEVRYEIEHSFQTLSDKNVNPVPVFCYPNGNCNREIIDQVKASGYQAAAGVQFGFEGPSPANLFELRRVNIHNDITATPALFAWHISGFQHAFRF